MRADHESDTKMVVSTFIELTLLKDIRCSVFATAHFEIKIGVKVCNFSSLYRPPGQMKN